eukprot:NODE_6945_length_338_cov_15.629758_g6214_i0.p1 GENE.NODE_6945_length_338_cov_15.629758_g6214_i0~~NODE_6945_length_338_cov_15.629758_g6214_i0.p1  ORF type:complete len:79 (-),score=9.94 NODE_6945_length_338_cov_15.629758_g6214_i0:51-287(-)
MGFGVEELVARKIAVTVERGDKVGWLKKAIANSSAMGVCVVRDDVGVARKVSTHSGVHKDYVPTLMECSRWVGCRPKR